MKITATDIGLTLGGAQILRGVSATFEPGQLTVILGPNGAGKSSLLSCLAGLRHPDSGSVTLDGTDIHSLDHRQRARSIGLLPQSAETHWNIRADALVALGRYPYQRGWGLGDTDKSAITAAMDATETADFAARSVNSLSGGERARVLMARVLAGEPQWILADEPLANLDPGHQIDMLELLKAQAMAGQGVVAVLHDLTSAAHYADSILLLNDGSVFASGPARDVLTRSNLRDVYGINTNIGDAPDGALQIQVTGRSA